MEKRRYERKSQIRVGPQKHDAMSLNRFNTNSVGWPCVLRYLIRQQRKEQMPKCKTTWRESALNSDNIAVTLTSSFYSLSSADSLRLQRLRCVDAIFFKRR